MGTNGASNELLWVRPDGPPPAGGSPDVCLTSDLVENRAQLGALGFLSCTKADETPGFTVITTDVNRSQVLSYPQGEGPPETVCDPAATDCGTRPNHVAINRDGVLAIADTASPARIGYFQPTGDCVTPYGEPQFSDPIRISGGGPPITVTGIADLEFSDQIGGNFAVNDLLVLASEPRMLLLVKDEDGSVEVLVSETEFAAAFGGATPLSATIVPGSGGLGNLQDSRSPVVLMGLKSPDRIVELRFDSDGSNTITDYSPGSNGVLVDANAGINPSRLDAGILENIDLLLAASGNGVFHQFTLDVEKDIDVGDSEVVSLSDPDPISIAAGVQNPGGIEILDDVVQAQLCVDDGAINDETGCTVGFGQFHFSQFVGVPEIDPNYTLSVDYDIFVDEDRTDGVYTLPDGGEVPSWCRGFPLPDDPLNREVLVQLRVTAGGFSVEPGETVQLKELLEELFPEFGTCPDSFARIAYLEDEGPDRAGYPGGYATTKEHRSISFSCTNPGRGAGPASSSFIYCRDAIKDTIEARGGRLNGRILNREIRPEIESRFARLEAFINTLPGDLGDASNDSTWVTTDKTSLQANLLALLEAARSSVQGGNPDFLAAAQYIDFAAVLVYLNKTPLSDGTLGGLGYGGPDNIYGILLSDSLALSFFFAQTLTTMDDLAAATPEPGSTEYYCPPQTLIQPVGAGELRDIDCSNSLPPIAFP
jgi:hypothetical protein